MFLVEYYRRGNSMCYHSSNFDFVCTTSANHRYTGCNQYASLQASIHLSAVKLFVKRFASFANKTVCSVTSLLLLIRLWSNENMVARSGFMKICAKHCGVDVMKLWSWICIFYLRFISSIIQKCPIDFYHNWNYEGGRDNQQ